MDKTISKGCVLDGQKDKMELECNSENEKKKGKFINYVQILSKNKRKYHN